MNKKPILPDEIILNKIYFIRGQKVMLDWDLAALYDVETKQLKRQVKRNINRFPKDFMFKLTRKEQDSLRSQFGTLKRGEHSKFLSMAFTEQGVAMLSSVLNSTKAIEVNIRIIRIFTKMREFLSTNKDILLKLEQLEGKVNKRDHEIHLIFEALKQLLNPQQPPRKRIGFKLKTENTIHGFANK